MLLFTLTDHWPVPMSAHVSAHVSGQLQVLNPKPVLPPPPPLVRDLKGFRDPPCQRARNPLLPKPFQVSDAAHLKPPTAMCQPSFKFSTLHQP